MALHVLTARSFQQIAIELGGSGFWKFNPKRAALERFVFMYRNASESAARMAGEHPFDPREHGTVFAVGEISEIIQAADGSVWSGRYLIRFERIAEYFNPDIRWTGQRNPVRYEPAPADFDEATVQWFDVAVQPLPSEMLNR